MNERRIRRLNRQDGVSNMTLVIYLLVTAIVLAGGALGLKYIEDAKVSNDVQELIDLKSSTLKYGNQHSGNFAGISLQIASGLNFFSPGRCTGAGTAAAACTNQWGGGITLAPTTINSANDGIAFTYSGIPSAACKKLGMEQQNVAAIITVGTTIVKTSALAALNEANLSTACDAAADNATLIYAVK